MTESHPIRVEPGLDDISYIDCFNRLATLVGQRSEFDDGLVSPQEAREEFELLRTELLESYPAAEGPDIADLLYEVTHELDWPAF